MRKLSAFEKEIVKKIVALSKDYNSFCVLGNCINIPLSITQNYITVDNQSLSNGYTIKVYMHNLSESEIIPYFNKLYIDLISTVNLLKYLVDNGYLYVGEYLDLYSVNEIENTEKDNSVELDEENLVTQISYYADHRLVATQPLILYVENDFKTDDDIKEEKEQQKHEQTMIVNKIFIGIAIIGTIMTGVSSYYTIKNEKSNCESSSDNDSTRKLIPKDSILIQK